MSVVIAAAASERLEPLTTQWISAATAHARFAAPDGDGTRLGPRCGLGHALLRLAHERAAQPLQFGDDIWFSGDIRLDDRAGLRRTLASAQRLACAEADDAELLARGYAVWGERVLEHVAGDFAFALWDERRQRLICACDQLGVVPLHFTQVRDQLLVASSPELLLLHPDVSDALDHEAVADFLLSGHMGRFGITTFAAIKRLPPGHLMRWSSGRLQLERYWRRPDREPLLRLSRPTDYVERFRHLLEAAVSDRADSGPLTTHLSGGMDSTSVSALAKLLRRDDAGAGELRALTVVLGEASGDSEGRFAALAAEAIGIEADVVDESVLGSTDPLAPPKLLTPEPTAYPWSDLDHQRLAIPARHSRTCLTGLGADPLLGFLPWYWFEWLARGDLTRLAWTHWEHARMTGRRQKLYLGTIAHHLLMTRRRPDPPTPSWMDVGFAIEVDARGRLRRDAARPSWLRDKRELTGHPGWQTWFTWGHPSYTRMPLRFRHPMADIRLLDFVSRIPPDPWLIDKRILRDATRDLLPQEILQRPKSPLVDAPRPSATPAARRALAELIAGVPAAEEFIDTAALRDTVLNPSGAPWQDWFLTRPLGLVYWLANRERPRVNMRLAHGRNA